MRQGLRNKDGQKRKEGERKEATVAKDQGARLSLFMFMTGLMRVLSIACIAVSILVASSVSFADCNTKIAQNG